MKKNTYMHFKEESITGMDTNIFRLGANQAPNF